VVTIGYVLGVDKIIASKIMVVMVEISEVMDTLTIINMDMVDLEVMVETLEDTVVMEFMVVMADMELEVDLVDTNKFIIKVMDWF